MTIREAGTARLPLSARSIVPGAPYVWAGHRVRAVSRPRYIPGGWSVLVRNEPSEYNAGMEYEVAVETLLLPGDWDDGYRYDHYTGMVRRVA